AHATRWDLDLPDRNGVFGYLADVLEHQLDRLGGGIELPARYFYDLSIRHEDMHVEALVYTRQTLGYAQPESLGRAATRRAGARGRRRGAGRALAARLDRRRWLHLRQREVGPRGRDRAVPDCQGAGHERRVRRLHRQRRLSPTGILERGGLDLARAPRRRAAGLLA